MVEAYSIAGFTQNQIAEVLDVDPKTLRQHCRKELDFARMNVIAKVAGNAVRFAIGAPAQFDENGKQIRAEQKPEAWAVCFVLKTLAKKQGWTEREPDEGGNVPTDFLATARKIKDALNSIETTVPAPQVGA